MLTATIVLTYVSQVIPSVTMEVVVSVTLVSANSITLDPHVKHVRTLHYMYCIHMWRVL